MLISFSFSTSASVSGLWVLAPDIEQVRFIRLTEQFNGALLGRVSLPAPPGPASPVQPQGGAVSIQQFNAHSSKSQDPAYQACLEFRRTTARQLAGYQLAGWEPWVPENDEIDPQPPL